MRITETRVPGAYRIAPDRFTDARGTFHEGLRTDLLEQATGRPFVPRQINYSVSRRNTLRGIHSVTVPPAQAKFVTCVRGALRDIIVDLRLGSPTYGVYDTSVLDAASGLSVLVPEGVGHGFLTLTDDACICYVLSSAHVPGTQVDIDPFDPDLALPWDADEPPLLSEKDAGAPTAAEAAAAGLLATWDEALAAAAAPAAPPP
ncbi:MULTISPECIES: dTDP-4-dehydrorhamnose 3,5-epimerase family protein [Streptomyces]|uniref:dTDP-4-dehydrorhamnose 3,5-epimerase family protein n=1 Tax=Streptomyces griseiscabiei TaxID=2993540 RepID=A0ABU4LI34_9ACTN|nr:MULTISPECIES: dTDP-4-dehydrorhamnose 3,5-epimerase family protein [Streptomyces]MBZ3907937.1 dTDP-4-dehydrorhamnose 3,5-epimerase family protein [Streptomyces griseiscabiei]MDX2915085.1 dTDP-4-dehydrorhamnose 3,5-epimerase family protein [Streptomyces griseiscabiei]